MKVMVTGGAGYLGETVVASLLARGHKVTVVDRLIYANYYIRPGVDFFRLDIRSKEFLELLAGTQWDAVVNTAAIVGDPACRVNDKLTWDVNANAVNNMVSTLKLANPHCHFIQLSTCSVYGDLEGPLDENSPTKPLSSYASSKLLAESFVSTLDCHTILRLGTVYGLSTIFGRVRNDLVANLMTFRAALAHPIRIVGGDQWRPIISAQDIGYCVGEVVDKDIKGLYILTSLNTKIGEIAHEIKRITGTTSWIHEEAINPSDMRNYHVNNDKARKAGLVPIKQFEDEIMAMHDCIKSGRIKNAWDASYNNGTWIGENYLGLS